MVIKWLLLSGSSGVFLNWALCAMELFFQIYSFPLAFQLFLPQLAAEIFLRVQGSGFIFRVAGVSSTSPVNLRF